MKQSLRLKDYNFLILFEYQYHGSTYLQEIIFVLDGKATRKVDCLRMHSDFVILHGA